MLLISREIILIDILHTNNHWTSFTFYVIEIEQHKKWSSGRELKNETKNKKVYFQFINQNWYNYEWLAISMYIEFMLDANQSSRQIRKQEEGKQNVMQSKYN